MSEPPEPHQQKHDTPQESLPTEKTQNDDTCPNCNANLQGDPIPPEDQEAFGGATHYSKLMGVYDRDTDRTTQWVCPYCKYRWERA